MSELTFTKGHGTLNDFVLLSDPENKLILSAADVSLLCDRRAGIGGDGVLRAVRARHIEEWSGDPDLWFMDYRNADGSLAEMCGNGLRVFVRFLVAEGLVEAGDLSVGTRAGLRHAWFLPDGRVRVSMGQVRVSDARVQVKVGSHQWAGIPVDVGNPHVVSVLRSEDQLATLDLSRAPECEPGDHFPRGVNAEFVELRGPGRLAMRVHERGSGETWSCGTGVVAAAAAVGGVGAGGGVEVEVPGGALEVRFADGEATLTGPAVLVAKGRWLPGLGDTAQACERRSS